MQRKDHMVIYSLRAAGYLMMHGCRLVRTEPQLDKPNLNQFIFYDDDKVNYYFDLFNRQEAADEDRYFRKKQARVRYMER